MTERDITTYNAVEDIFEIVLLGVLGALSQQGIAVTGQLLGRLGGRRLANLVAVDKLTTSLIQGCNKACLAAEGSLNKIVVLLVDLQQGIDINLRL